MTDDFQRFMERTAKEIEVMRQEIRQLKHNKRRRELAGAARDDLNRRRRERRAERRDHDNALQRERRKRKKAA